MIVRAAVLAAGVVLAYGGFSLVRNTSTSSTQTPQLVAEVRGYMKGYETVTWPFVAGVSGFALNRDGVRVATAGPGATSTRFFLLTAGQHVLNVTALFATSTTTAPSTSSATTTAPTTTVSTETPVKTWDTPGVFGDGWEFGGTFDGTPTLSQRVSSGSAIDGISKPSAAPSELKIQVAPGDAYGSSSGWRTLGHMYDPSKFTFPAGSSAWFVWSMYAPAGYPSGADMYVSPLEMHQTKASNVNVTGPAPFNFDASSDHIDVVVRGGYDGQGASGWLTNIHDTVAFSTGRWYSFALHETFSPDPNGNVELWEGVQGGQPVQVISHTAVRTMYYNSNIYPLFGLYRNQAGTSAATVYTAGLRQYQTQAGALAWLDQLAG